MVEAFLTSDASCNGLFWTGVKTTHIFCKPACPARKPKPENVEFFFSVRDAMFAGYRACLRCKPLAPADPPAWVKKLLAMVEGETERISARHVVALGIEPARARRYFIQTYGMTFAEYARAKRLCVALGQLRRGGSIDDAGFDAGYGSLSGFREAFRRAFGAPPGQGRDADVIISKLIQTPVGPMMAGATSQGVCLLEFTDRKMLEKQLATLRQRLKTVIVPGESPHLSQLERELHAYFAGVREDFSVPLVAPGTAFQERVWEGLRKIPYGTTVTYAELARSVGKPKAIRALGTANGMNRIAILIPCHRVVRAGGEVGGYGGGRHRKEYLLALERAGVPTNLQAR